MLVLKIVVLVLVRWCKILDSFVVVVEIVVIILATGGARSLLFLVLKIAVLVLATGGARSSTLRRTSTSRSSFPEKTQQPGKLIKKNTEKLLC